MSDLQSGTSMTGKARVRRNHPLIAGGLLLALIIFLAVFGPLLAPRDPREQNLVIRVDDQWLTPPYRAFTPGFALGSDSLGRDLFSWLLWAVRPTMGVIGVVATLRMLLGTTIGLIAGWSERAPGHLADAMIAAALAAPTLIVALIVITAVGFRLGVWAFVAGLAATGWADTAQMVRARVRLVKRQEAIEAARALGSSGAQILVLHVMPQVMPLIWSLLAFEVSSTLTTAAGLGFLGYYMGGAVFAEVDDFVYQRISEMPELGQMLATAWLVLDEPWAMVAAGSVVFLIVLTFTLLGEGLQLRLVYTPGGHRALYKWLAGNVMPWFSDRVEAATRRLPTGRAARNKG